MSDLPNREFKTAVIKMLPEVRREMHEQSEDFNKDTKKVL